MLLPAPAPSMLLTALLHPAGAQLGRLSAQLLLNQALQAAGWALSLVCHCDHTNMTDQYTMNAQQNLDLQP